MRIRLTPPRVTAWTCLLLAISYLAFANAEEPYAVAVNPNTNTVYVGDQYSNGTLISVINGATNTVVATIPGPLGYEVYGIAVNPNTNTVYALVGSFWVYVINGATNAITAEITLTYRCTGGIVIDTSSDIVFTGCDNCNYLQAINGATNTELQPPFAFPSGTVVNHLAWQHGPATLYVSGEGDAVFDYSEFYSRYETLGAYYDTANEIAYDSYKGALYVSETTSNGSANFLVDVNVQADTATAILLPPKQAQGIAFNASTNRAYVLIGNGQAADGSVEVINTTNDSLVANITVGKGVAAANPDNIAVNPVTNMIYAANWADNTVSVINGSTNGVVSTIAVQ